MGLRPLALRRKSAAISCLLLLASSVPPSAAGKKKDNAIPGMDERKRAVHALSRLTFGPRPGETDRVAAMGVEKWIDQQLHPEKIDDAGLQSRLSAFRTLRMDNREIVENFPSEQQIKQIADGKAEIPNDPLKNAVYRAQLVRFEDKQARKEAAAAGEDAKPGQREENRVGKLEIADLEEQPPDQRFKQVL